MVASHKDWAICPNPFHLQVFEIIADDLYEQIIRVTFIHFLNNHIHEQSK